MLQSHSQYKYKIVVFVCRLVVAAQWLSACALSKQAVLGSNPIDDQI